MLTLWTLIEASVLCLNAICILNEDRFLAKVGWGTSRPSQGYGEALSLKGQILHIIQSIRTVTRIPLIFFNIITIGFKLLFG